MSETPSRRPTAPPVPGQLVLAWRAMLVVTWIGVLFAYAAVWKASEEIGIGTWWLGTRSNPSPALVRLIPFAIAVAVGVVIAYNLPRAWWASLGGSLALIALSLPDFSRSTGLALVELTIGLAALVVTLFALSGRYRVAAAPRAPEAHSDTESAQPESSTSQRQSSESPSP